jgi:hypothetical protein
LPAAVVITVFLLMMFSFNLAGVNRRASCC